MSKLPKLLVFAGLLIILSALPIRAETGTDPVPTPDPGDTAICDSADFVTKYLDTKLMTKDQCLQLVGLFGQNKSSDGPWYNQNPRQFATKVLGGNQGEIFGERYTYAQINWILNSIATMLNPAANIDSPAKLLEFLNTARDLLKPTGQLPTLHHYAKLGPVGLFAGGLSALYANPPASAIAEAKNLASRVLDVSTPALAQGYGFAGLDSGGAVRALWTASRNMAYLVIILILIASGFLIMFRVKINPQTVVSLQTMIPKLVITLLLVTFSFAIAGLVIDLVYVFIAGFVGFLNMSGVFDFSKSWSGVDSIGSLISLLSKGDFMQYISFQWPLITMITLLISLLFLNNPLTAIIFPITIIVTIVMLIHFLITLFKIFFMLFKSYVTIIIQIMVGPLQIMLDMLPGQQGFGPWMRQLVAECSVFVVVPMMLILQYVFVSGTWFGVFPIKDFGERGGNFLSLPFSGPKLSGQVFGVLWDNSALIRFFIAYFIFALTPKVADMIREILKVPAFKYGAAAAGEVAGVVKFPVTQGLAYTEGFGKTAAKKPGISPTAAGMYQAIGDASEWMKKQTAG